MRKKIQIGFFISVAFLCSLLFVQAASVFQTIQGGTGTSSPSGILYGSGSASPLKTVSIGSNLTFSGGTLSATDTSFSTTSASYFSSLGLAFSTTSSSHFTSVGLSFSTTSSDYWLTQRQGASFSTTSANYWSTFGLGHSTTSVAYQLTQPITLGNATATNFFASLASSTNLFSTFATTSKLTVTDYASTTALTISGVRSAALITSATGVVSGASATTCTNQFVRSISAVMAGTCASISNADWSGTDLSVANGGTGLSTFGGSGTVLFTTAADTLSSDTDMTYDGTRNRLTLLHASTTAVGITGTLYLPNSYFGSTLNGIGSTTPSALVGTSLGTTTAVMNALFSTGLASSTANLPTVVVQWGLASTTNMAGNTFFYLLQQNTNFVLNSTSSRPAPFGISYYTMIFCQDGTGGRTVTWTNPGSIGWAFPDGSATPTIKTTANTAFRILFEYQPRTQRYFGIATSSVTDPRYCLP